MGVVSQRIGTGEKPTASMELCKGAAMSYSSAKLPWLGYSRWRTLPRSLAGLVCGSALGLLLAVGHSTLDAQAQTNDGGTITLQADIQEANSLTGVITARGNVQLEYPSRQIYATSAQAQYFNEEQRIILSGNVVVLQAGNRLEAETITYLIDEGRFVALPQPNQQVRSTYVLPATEEPSATPGSAAVSDASPNPVTGDNSLTAPLEPARTLDVSPIE